MEKTKRGSEHNIYNNTKSDTIISIIVAMNSDRVIGIGNSLPWHISSDLQNFKRITSGNTVIMGRKTYESIGKPLPNRNNIVVSRTWKGVSGVEVCRDISSAISTAKKYGKEIFIIGGANIYSQFLDIADKMYISFVDRVVEEGDVFFPSIDYNKWKLVETQKFEEFELRVYSRSEKLI